MRLCSCSLHGQVPIVNGDVRLMSVYSFEMTFEMQQPGGKHAMSPAHLPYWLFTCAFKPGCHIWLSTPDCKLHWLIHWLTITAVNPPAHYAYSKPVDNIIILLRLQKLYTCMCAWYMCKCMCITINVDLHIVTRWPLTSNTFLRLRKQLSHMTQ